MLEGKGSRDEPARLGSQHEEFFELCALATSGSLNDAEAKRLKEHLAICSECREMIHEFQAVVDRVIPELTSEPETEILLDPAFSQERAEFSLKKRLAAEKEMEQRRAASVESPPAVRSHGRGLREYLHRYQVWLPMVASALLCVTFGILSYRTGRKHGIESAQLEQGDKPAVEAGLAKAPAARSTEARDRELAVRDAALANLRQEIAQKAGEIEKLKALTSSQQVALQNGADDKNGIAEERDRLRQQVSAGEETLRITQERLKALERERSEYVIQTASLETRVADLSRSLQDREHEASERQDLLAKDRDIRELIGARELYISEIYDVVNNGDTRKAAGRVFFTRGKSLVFYAYDLNENPGVKDASTFEAWGQRGSDWHQASRLGIFYEDNVAKKSWVVKSSDGKALSQIDAVFVTIEPNGGSERPTGKPLLFAYLKAAPNHP